MKLTDTQKKKIKFIKLLCYFLLAFTYVWRGYYQYVNQLNFITHYVSIGFYYLIITLTTYLLS